MNVETLKTLVSQVEFAIIGELPCVLNNDKDTIVQVSPNGGNWTAYCWFQGSHMLGYAQLEDYPEILALLEGQTVGFILHM